MNDYGSSAWAQTLKDGLKKNDERIENASLEDGWEIVTERGKLIRDAMSCFYRQVVDDCQPNGPFAIYALGGTGRHEACPLSDVDTGIIVEKYEDEKKLESYIEEQIKLIIDIVPGITSAKFNDVTELKSEEHYDFPSLLSLLDGDLLAGDPQFAERIRQKCRQRATESGLELIFFARQELSRLDKFHPNSPGDVGVFHTKKGKGGLRNFQLPMWLYAFERWLPSRRVYELGKATRRFDNDGAPTPEVLAAVGIIFAARCWIERCRQLKPIAGRMPNASAIEADDMHIFVERFGTSGLLKLNTARATIRDYRRNAMDRLLEQGVAVPKTDGLVVLGQNGLHLGPDSLFSDPTETFFSIYEARQQLQLPIDESVKRAARKTAAKTVTTSAKFMRIMRSPGEVYPAIKDWSEYRLLAKFIPEFGRLANQLYSLRHRSATLTREARSLQRIRNLEHLATVPINELHDSDEVFFARQYRAIGNSAKCAVRLALLSEEIPQSIYNTSPEDTYDDEQYISWARRYIREHLSTIPGIRPSVLRTIEFLIVSKRDSLRDSEVSAQPHVIDAWQERFKGLEAVEGADTVRALSLFLYAAFDYQTPKDVDDPRLKKEQWSNVRNLMQNLLYRELGIDDTTIDLHLFDEVGQRVLKALPDRLLAGPHVDRSIQTNYAGDESLDPLRASRLISKISMVIKTGSPIVEMAKIDSFYRAYIIAWDSPGLFWRIAQLLYSEGCSIRTTDLYIIPYNFDSKGKGPNDAPKQLIYDVISFDAARPEDWLEHLAERLKERIKKPTTIIGDDTVEILAPILLTLSPKIESTASGAIRFSCQVPPTHKGTHYAICRLLSELVDADILSIVEDGTHDWPEPRVDFYFRTPHSIEHVKERLKPHLGL